MKNIYYIERNAYNAIIIHGIIGTLTYYFYTKRNAIKNYNNKCKEIRNGNN